MKKFIALVAVLAILTLAIGTLSACYVSNPAKLDNVVGTYHLTVYTRSYPAEKQEGDETAPVHNYIEEKGVDAYLVITKDGNGFYVYKDNETPLYARVIKVSYAYDEEDNTLVKSLDYSVNPAISGDGCPNKGKETLGVNFKKKNKILSYYYAAVDIGALHRKYSQTVRYEKVSDATDLSYVARQLGTLPAYAPYEVAEMDSLFTSSNYYDDANPYVYYYVDLHPATRKADVYYALKSDKVSVVQRNLDVTFDIPAYPEGSYQPVYITTTIGGEVFYSDYYGTAPAVSLQKFKADGTVDYYFTGYDRAGVDISARIAADLAAYEDYLAQ